MNFRDVLNALGIVPAPWLGLDSPGSCSRSVMALWMRAGDRVMGLGQAIFATVAIAGTRASLSRSPSLSLPKRLPCRSLS